MCGIAGYLRSSRSIISPQAAADIVRKMTATMAHRGPDADGLWIDPDGRCILGHRRLSIIDTSDAGVQPMTGRGGRSVITFNGEIYNFLELKPQLTAAGVQFKGRTDTEVLIEALGLWGTDALSRLDGMFAFGVFDTVTGELLLARDPFGEKPLYYIELASGDLAFASELQALEKVPGFDFTVDVNAMAEVLTFQYIGAPRSIYTSVRKLGAGRWLKVGPHGQTRTGRYFEFRPGLSGFTDRPVPELVDELEDILTRSIQRRLISDVPLGAFLSGGVDSSTVCALIRRKLNRPLMTFSIGFKGAPESEHLTARAFADHLGTIHHEQILDPNVTEFLTNIGDILDEPNADSSCLPTYLVSQFARQHVTVAVSGDGGDEMFGGYGRYMATLDELSRHRAGALAGWRPGDAYYGDRILVAAESCAEELFGFVPPSFAHHLGLLRLDLNENADQLLCEMRRTDVNNYMPGAVLPKVDRMSMRHSLEVRTPFLNVELARFAERLPDSVLVQKGHGKILLRELAYRYLPRELINLPKQGFALPMSDWARSSLLDVTGSLIESDDSRLRQAFGSDGMAHFMDRQRTAQFSSYQVWAVAMLESWLRRHPAKVPSFLEERSTGYAVSSKNEILNHGLIAVPIGNKAYLVARGDADRPIDPRHNGTFKGIPAELIEKAIELSNGDTVRNFGLAGASTSILPDWGAPLTNVAVCGLSDLRGSTLLFVDLDAALRFDYAEYEKLIKLGIDCVIFRSAYVTGALDELKLRRFGRLRRFLNIVKLYRRRVAVLWNRPMLSLSGLIPFWRNREEGFESKIITAIDPIQDEELSGTYMLFEGARQMPPIQSSHADIGKEGRGRYSIWNQILTFSPSQKERLDSRPYWLVRSSPETEPYLPIKISRTRQTKVAAIEDAVAKIFAKEQVEEVSLVPGDSVVVYTHGLPAGGAERQWVYLAQSLKDAGYRVTFVVSETLKGESAHYLPLLKASDIPIIEISKYSIFDLIGGWPRTPEALALLNSDFLPEKEKVHKLCRALFDCAPKVLFAQLDETNLIAGYAAHIANVPRVVMSFRNYNPTNFPYLNKDWYKASYQFLARSPRVLLSGNFKGANADYADWIGIDPSRITSIPNAIDPATFPLPQPAEIDAVRTELKLSRETPVILGAFRLSSEKDPYAFVDVCARVIDEKPEVRAFIAGVGPLHNRIEERINNCGMQGRITLLGRRSDINVLMNIASVFLMTSIKEGMPNVVMEAQLMGRPVVATPAGGTPDVVIDGETAWLCPIGDIPKLAAACLEVLGNPELAKRFGDAGRKNILTHFQKKKLGERYIRMAGARLRPIANYN